MIRRVLLTFILAISGFTFSYAGGIETGCPVDYPSPDGKSREQIFKEIQEFKMKYLAQEMELKEDQRQQFIELYDEMSRRRFALMKSARDIEKRVKKIKDATEEDYQSVTEAWNKAKVEDAEIEKEYDAKFSVFLTQKQIFKMKTAEESFRKKMEEMRHKGAGRHKNK